MITVQQQCDKAVHAFLMSVSWVQPVGMAVEVRSNWPQLTIGGIGSLFEGPEGLWRGGWHTVGWNDSHIHRACYTSVVTLLELDLAADPDLMSCNERYLMAGPLTLAAYRAAWEPEMAAHGLRVRREIET